MLTPKNLTVGAESRIEAILSLANAAIVSAERLAALNLDTSRKLMEDNLATAKALLGATSQKELAELQASLLQPAVEKAVAYSRAVYDISTTTQGEVSKLVEAELAEVQKGVSSAVAEASKSAPAGSEVAVDALKRSVEAANTAFATLTQAANQVKAMAEANLNTAADASVKAAGDAAKAALKAVKL